MYWKLLAAVVFCQGLLISTARADVMCGTDTLANYIKLGTGGCDVGRLGFMDFGFFTISSSEGATAVTAADITVSPVMSGDEIGLSYASSDFSVSAGQSIQYLLTYTIDDPPIIHGFDLEMFTDPPLFPGIAKIDSLECVGSAFVGTKCAGQTTTNSVFDNGATALLQDTEFFAPSITVGERTTITLDATSGGSASFTRFNEQAIVPEPASVWLLTGSLLLLLWPRRALR